MKRIGIYGGTFDPPHIGHVRAVQYALCTLKLDELWAEYNKLTKKMRTRREQDQ